MKRWKIGSPDLEIAKNLCAQGGISLLCAKVLAARHICSLEMAQELLETQTLSAPLLLRDMEKAAERILKAVDTGERICVYGDYDCDGVTATVILTDWLQCAGANVTWFIPTREEGYGMRADRIRTLHEEGVSLIVTVDNGISAIEEAKTIQELGMELIVTDHHRAQDQIPDAYAVIDPYRADCSSPYKTICGAVVALKLVAALEGSAEDCEPAIEQFGELAALATIADVMPLDSENRYLVRRGLELLRNTERVGLLALMNACGMNLDAAISAESVMFLLNPRINAAGRFGTAALAAKLFLTDDPEEAQSLAEEICTLNQNRKKTEEEVLKEISEKIRRNPASLTERVLIFTGENWHHGVIGIVASRLLERFGKPCFLMSREAEGYRGSARSFGDFSIFACLQECSALLLRYGGHMSAGGFTVSEENHERFCQAVQDYAARTHPVMPVMEAEAVCVLPLQDITVENIEGLSVLEPYGNGNPKPYFVLAEMTVSALHPLSGGKHTKLRLCRENRELEALIFRRSPAETGLSVGMSCDFLVSLGINVYQGRKSVNIVVEDWRRSEAAQQRFLAAQQAYDSYQRGEPLSLAYYKRMCPTREDLVAVYRFTGSMAHSLMEICNRLPGMNYCRARICADILSELKLIAYDPILDAVTRLPVTQKQNLDHSAAFRKIRQLAEQA